MCLPGPTSLKNSSGPFGLAVLCRLLFAITNPWLSMVTPLFIALGALAVRQAANQPTDQLPLWRNPETVPEPSGCLEHPAAPPKVGNLDCWSLGSERSPPAAIIYVPISQWCPFPGRESASRRCRGTP